jgi:hypothetical protein
MACSVFISSAVLHLDTTRYARFGKRNSHISQRQLGHDGVAPRQATWRVSLKRSAPCALCVPTVPVASARTRAIKAAHRSAPDRSCQAVSPSSLRRTPAQTRRPNRAPRHASSAPACSSRELRVRLAAVCGVARRSSERQRRRQTSGCSCRSSGSLPSADTRGRASASGKHKNTTGLGVSSRWCRCGTHGSSTTLVLLHSVRGVRAQQGVSSLPSTIQDVVTQI